MKTALKKIDSQLLFPFQGASSDSSSSSADSDSEGGGSAGILSLLSSILGASSGVSVDSFKYRRRSAG